METYSVKPIFYNKDCSSFSLDITAPGSKSITNRALMLAALANGTTVLHGALFSDDSRHFLKCLQDLGFSVIIDEPACTVTVTGHGGRIPKSEASIYVGSAGTAARFLTAMLGCAPGTWYLDASAQMRRRPMAPLLKALRDLGCTITCEENEGFFPFTIVSHGISAAETTVDIGDSSQFLSAFLMASVMLDHDFDIHITGTHGLAYIDMTMKMMQQFGAAVSSADGRNYHIAGTAGYQSCTYQIEPDVSAAAYFYGMAAISGGSVRVNHVHWNSLQGDIQLLKVFEKMGCTAVEEFAAANDTMADSNEFAATNDTMADSSEFAATNDTMADSSEFADGSGSVFSGKVSGDGIRLTGPAAGTKLRGISIDMSSFSDQALTVAAIAPFADGDVRICNVGHIRLQESDRMNAIVENLGRMGVSAEICGDNDADILIRPTAPEQMKPAHIETYEDHRVAMAFSLTGLKNPRVVIDNPGCCRKTFENYFEVLDQICGEQF